MSTSAHKNQGTGPTKNFWCCKTHDGADNVTKNNVILQYVIKNPQAALTKHAFVEIHHINKYLKIITVWNLY